MREKIRDLIGDEINQELQSKDIESMVFLAKTSKEYLEFKKADEQLPFKELLEKHNCWECFENSVFKLIFKSKSIEVQWKILSRLNDIDLHSDEYVHNFSCVCIFQRNREDEVGRLIINSGGTL